VRNSLGAARGGARGHSETKKKYEGFDSPSRRCATFHAWRGCMQDCMIRQDREAQKSKEVQMMRWWLPKVARTINSARAPHRPSSWIGTTEDVLRSVVPHALRCSDHCDDDKVLLEAVCLPEDHVLTLCRKRMHDRHGRGKALPLRPCRSLRPCEGRTLWPLLPREAVVSSMSLIEFDVDL